MNLYEVLSNKAPTFFILLKRQFLLIFQAAEKFWDLKTYDQAIGFVKKFRV